jgi:hypothetical protein
LYAKYYFELRALFKDNEKEFPLKPLDKYEAEKLEVRSGGYQEAFEEAIAARHKASRTIGAI